MCELLALSTSQPSRLTFSLHALAARGGEAGTTHDGWGVAFYQGHDVALFREPRAAEGSALVGFLETQGPRTELAISHIRHATRGTISFANTQPFIRELGGRTHVFAHNGDLPGLDAHASRPPGTFRPVGETDSELAFCAMLARLKPLWDQTAPPALEARMEILAGFAAQLRLLGPANFLYADGDTLFAHGHRRIHPETGAIEPPGLWTLLRHCEPADPPAAREAGVAIAQEELSAIFFASVPLTDEDWRPLAEGELLAVRRGGLLARRLAAAASP